MMTYLNKKVQVRIIKRGNDNKSEGYTFITGVCELEPQSNELLGWKLQTTVSRMPIELDSLNDIKIIE